MKKYLALAFAAMMLLTFAACGSQSAAPTEAPTEAAVTEPAVSETAAAETEVPETEAPTEAATEAPAVELEGTVLVNNENCAFSVSAINENDHLGMTLEATCVNKTDKDLFFTWNTVSVCGYLYDPLWSQEVAPGETVNSTVYIDTYQLEQLGITSVDVMEFTLYVFDRNDFLAEPFVNDVFTIYPTGLTADTVFLPQRASVAGEQVITGDGDVDFIIESYTDTAGNFTLRCYLGNNSDDVLVFAWENVLVNGAPIDPMWAQEIPAGKRAYGEITFFSGDLESQSIDTVEEIEFTLLITDLEGEAVLEDTFTFRAEDSLVG